MLPVEACSIVIDKKWTGRYEYKLHTTARVVEAYGYAVVFQAGNRENDQGELKLKKMLPYHSISFTANPALCNLHLNKEF